MAAAGVDSRRRSALPEKTTMRGILSGNSKGTSIADRHVGVGT